MKIDVQNTVKDFFRKKALSEKDLYVVAVSGGVDSMVLLHTMHVLGYRMIVAHCNFHLRGEDSDGDEAFVRLYCKEQQIPIEVVSFETRAYASKQGVSIEMAARDLRYEWFETIRQHYNARAIVVAHHADDVAETLFINLCRGTGIRGLIGIRGVNGYVMRPMLDCSRQDISEYAERNDLKYRTDVTNASLEYMRNVIRHKIIPICKDINPSFLSTVRSECAVFNETKNIYEYGISQLKQQVCRQEGKTLYIDISGVITSPAPYTLLFEILSPYGFNKTQIGDVLNSGAVVSRKQFYTSTYQLVRERDGWQLFERKGTGDFVYEIKGEGVFFIEDNQYTVERVSYTTDFSLKSPANIVYMDAQKVQFPLKVRAWLVGDRFFPLGMRGLSKKLSDYFANLKYGVQQKESVRVLLSGDDIAWVVNIRSDERFKVTRSTKEILKITVNSKNRETV